MTRVYFADLTLRQINASSRQALQNSDRSKRATLPRTEIGTAAIPHAKAILLVNGIEPF